MFIPMFTCLFQMLSMLMILYFHHCLSFCRKTGCIKVSLYTDLFELSSSFCWHIHHIWPWLLPALSGDWHTPWYSCNYELIHLFNRRRQLITLQCICQGVLSYLLVILWFCHYCSFVFAMMHSSFCRIHSLTRVSPCKFLTPCKIETLYSQVHFSENNTERGRYLKIPTTAKFMQ